MSSQEYFNKVANQWDTMRKGFFANSVREKIYQVAQLEKGKTAADLGAGTGFITEGLIENGIKVIAVDQSTSMLDKMKENFSNNKLIDCRIGYAEKIPIDDNSVDYSMANMFLHHVDTPSIAIKEMVRILKPGGKIIITDLDKHNFEFLKKEHHDKWLGFIREDIYKWFQDVNLKNIVIDCVGENCSTTSSCNNEIAKISIFIAFGQK